MRVDVPDSLTKNTGGYGNPLAPSAMELARQCILRRAEERPQRSARVG